MVMHSCVVHIILCSCHITAAGGETHPGPTQAPLRCMDSPRTIPNKRVMHWQRQRLVNLFPGSERRHACMQGTWYTWGPGKASSPSLPLWALRRRLVRVLPTFYRRSPPYLTRYPSLAGSLRVCPGPGVTRDRYDWTPEHLMPRAAFFEGLAPGVGFKAQSEPSAVLHLKSVECLARCRTSGCRPASW